MEKTLSVVNAVLAASSIAPLADDPYEPGMPRIVEVKRFLRRGRHATLVLGVALDDVEMVDQAELSIEVDLVSGDLPRDGKVVVVPFATTRFRGTVAHAERGWRIQWEPVPADRCPGHPGSGMFADAVPCGCGSLISSSFKLCADCATESGVCGRCGLVPM